jgi:N-acetylneuraminate lyase
MNKMSKKQLRGLVAAPFTPMDEEGHLNLDPVAQYATHLINSGVTGAFVCGTTGEGLSLTTEERKTVLGKWVSCSNGTLKIIAHVGGNCLPQSIELAAHAQESGAWATGAFAPSFFKPGTAEELVSFLAPVAAAAPDLPFYYYHIPSLTGVNLPVVKLLSHAEKMIPNFAGVKFTHFDLYDMQQCIAYNHNRFEILHGYDEVLLAGLSLGIKAAVGSTYNYMPSVYLGIWEAYDRLDMHKARELQQFSVRIVKILIKYGGGVRAGKAFMKLSGIDCGPCRLPLTKFNDTELDKLKNELTEAGYFRMLDKGNF